MRKFRCAFAKEAAVKAADFRQSTDLHLMGLFDKLFGKKKASSPAPQTPPTAAHPSANRPQEAPMDPSKDPTMIRVFDSYGRELFITRQQWRENVLQGNIRKVWNEPGALYDMIISALQDGFRADVVDAARQLYKIDPNPTRGACIWGIVLMEENHLTEAEQVLQDHVSRHGENGIILTNLAKVYDRQGHPDKSEKLLWRALELDCNQDNAVAWYAAIHRERGGHDAEIAALRRVAALPGSWRPQLWLARATLQNRDLEAALALYRVSLLRAGNPAPGDLLMQISGDLGNAGHIPEILQLVAPHFDATAHGIQVGNNLIKAHLDLGQLDESHRILEALYALKRPDWKETLAFWETEITKARLGAQPKTRMEDLQYAMLSIDGPIWLKPSSPTRAFYPPRETEGQLITFLGSSSENAAPAREPEHQMADAAGQLSRAVPLFLAEQVELGSDAAAHTIIPWITKPTKGFVVFGGAVTDEAAVQYSQMSATKCDYVVVTHLVTKSDPWTVRLRLLRAIDGKCLAEITVSFPPRRPEDAIRKLGRDLLQLLHETAQVVVRPPLAASAYLLPEGTAFSDYLLRLEQLLVVRCASHDNSDGFIHREREIVDGNIRLCLAVPQSVNTRLVFAQTMLAMKEIRPEIVAESHTKLTSLQTEHPLPAPYQDVISKMVADATAS